MKNRSPKIFISILILFLANSIFATENTATIDLSVTHTEYVSLTGTVVGANRVFSDDDVRPQSNGQRGPKVELGTLGVKSNIPGNCTLSLTTANGFRLRHINTNQRLAGYRLLYQGQRFNRRNSDITQSCNTDPSPLEFSTNKNYRNTMQTGIYQDKVTIVVTTE